MVILWGDKLTLVFMLLGFLHWDQPFGVTLLVKIFLCLFLFLFTSGFLSSSSGYVCNAQEKVDFSRCGDVFIG